METILAFISEEQHIMAAIIVQWSLAIGITAIMALLIGILGAVLWLLIRKSDQLISVFKAYAEKSK